MSANYFAQTLIEQASWWYTKWEREECSKKSKKDSVSGRGACVDELKREFSEKTADEGTPWCAEWVSVCYSTARKKLRLKGNGKLPYTRSTLAMLDGAKKNGLLVDENPAVGSIFFRYRKSGGHVGIVVKIDDNGKIYTTEGNSSNAVLGRSYTKDKYAAWQFIHVELEETVSAAAFAFREPLRIFGTLLLTGGIIAGTTYGYKRYKANRSDNEKKSNVPKGVADILDKHGVQVPSLDRTVALKANGMGDLFPVKNFTSEIYENK